MILYAHWYTICKLGLSKSRSTVRCEEQPASRVSSAEHFEAIVSGVRVLVFHIPVLI
jgi:hypothetical protein